MRRLDAGGFHTLQFDAFERVGKAALIALQLGDYLRLRHHHLVQLFVLMFEMRKVRFDFVQPGYKFFVHAATVKEISAANHAKDALRSAAFMPLQCG